MRSTAAQICSRSRTSARKRNAVPPACSISSLARSSSALLARSKAELDLAKLEIEHAGGTALRFRADVRDLEQICAAVDRMRVHYGSVDILIAAAGSQGPIGPLVEAKADVWADAVGVNLMGVLHACQAVLPAMIERRSGKIIV